MRESEIPLAPDVDCRVVECVIDEAIPAAGLTTVLRGTLKQHAGCIHWHVKRGRQAGTLEVTLWPRERRAWFTVQSGREADWVDQAMEQLAEAIQQRLDLADA